MTDKLRLLYLGFAFPPGVAQLHPQINPAGHAIERQMIYALRQKLEIRSVGTVPFAIEKPPGDAAPDSGVAHELLLVKKYPELWHRVWALSRLKRQYLRWRAEGWKPAVVMTYNLSPEYNFFIRWLRTQSDRPRLVLLLLDSAQLGVKVSAWKSFRHRLKPLTASDRSMTAYFDGCIGLSPAVEQYFTGRPFLWMPGACTPGRAPLEKMPVNGPIRFGYFGALAAHTGALEMAKIFLSLAGDNELHVCGYGRQSVQFGEMARQYPRLKFHGLLSSPDECLKFGQMCDVLVSPRPAGQGNENNMASKLFEYALCRRAIIASRISGTDRVLGQAAFFYDPLEGDRDIRHIFEEVVKVPRDELLRRGRIIGDRIMGDYNWTAQAERMAQWLSEICVAK